MWRDLKDSIESYLDATTVHGFKYVHKENHWILRIVWVSEVYKMDMLKCDSKSKIAIAIAYHHLNWVLHVWEYHKICNS